MCSHTTARGVRGYAPLENFDKNGVIWCNFWRPKYVITNLKFNNFKGKNQQENLIAIFLSQSNLDEHVSTKINTYRIKKGGLGGEAEEILKNQTKWRLFLIFGKAPYMLPISPKL